MILSRGGSWAWAKGGIIKRVNLRPREGRLLIWRVMCEAKVAVGHPADSDINNGVCGVCLVLRLGASTPPDVITLIVGPLALFGRLHDNRPPTPTESIKLTAGCEIPHVHKAL